MAKKNLVKPDPKKSLDFFVQARNGKKRNYAFGYSKAKKCSHPNLVALSIGGTWYRCTECNYAYCIVAAYAQPLHNLVIGGILNALHFAKEFGGDSLGEVLRRPIGQYDGTAHKAVLPEGMDFEEAVAALEDVDVHAVDGGKAELNRLLDKTWVSEKERQKRKKQLEGIDPDRRPKELPDAYRDEKQGQSSRALPDPDTGEMSSL